MRTDAPLDGRPEPADCAGARMHVAIAEQGKVYALEGRHPMALAYYREAIRMTVHDGDPEIVFRHYLECVLESLEKMGAYAELLDYCEKALALLEAAPDTPQTALERAHVHQRHGCVLLKAGRHDEATVALRRALALAAPHGVGLPLAATLAGWIDRGLRIDPARVRAEQEHTRYFNVRRDTVDAARAVRLPHEALVVGMHAGKGAPWQHGM